MENSFCYKTIIGTICIKDNGTAVTALYIDNSKSVGTGLETEIIHGAYKQLDEYFHKKRRIFTVPIKLIGTPFQIMVWNELLKIPYGEVCSYGDIARGIGKPKASRAVGGANNKNRIMIIVPCHRVIGVNGNLVGYGCGLATKKFLLDLEKSF